MQSITRGACRSLTNASARKRTRSESRAPLQWPFGGGDPTTRDANRRWFRTRPVRMLLVLLLLQLLVLMMSTTMAMVANRPTVLAMTVLPLMMARRVWEQRLPTLVPETNAATTSEKARRVKLRHSRLRQSQCWYQCQSLLQCQCHFQR